MARYDYGFRGEWDMAPRQWRRRRAPSYDLDIRRPESPRPYRVTARYNIDYVRARPDDRRFNPIRYGGAWRDQIIGEEEYRYPYMTRGGTRTHRGVGRPPPYRYWESGPPYGGRYPDEL